MDNFTIHRQKKQERSIRININKTSFFIPKLLRLESKRADEDENAWAVFCLNLLVYQETQFTINRYELYSRVHTCTQAHKVRVQKNEKAK